MSFTSKNKRKVETHNNPSLFSTDSYHPKKLPFSQISTAAKIPIIPFISSPLIKKQHNQRMTKSCKISIKISDKRLVKCKGIVEEKNISASQQEKSKGTFCSNTKKISPMRYPSLVQLASKGFGQPSKHHCFTSGICFEHILVILFKSGFLSQSCLRNVTSTHLMYQHLHKTILRSNSIDFSKLRTLDPNYDRQVEVPFSRKMQALAACIHYNMHVPSVIRYCGGLYTGTHRDPTVILSDLSTILPPHICLEIRRLYTVGAPKYFNGHSDRQNFLNYRHYGNHSSIKHKPELIRKALNKEDQHRFALPFPGWVSRFIPNLHLTPEGLIVRPGKNDRIIFDASFRMDFDSQCVNMWSNPDREPPIRYGTTFLRHLIRIWNLRITYPKQDIYLWDDDIAGAFRLVKYNPEIAPAFASLVQGDLWIPTSQVFGSNTSPQNFEVLANAREIVAEHFSSPEFHHLITKHNEIIDKVQFEEVETSISTANFEQAIKDTMHQGVHGIDETPKNTPHNTFVDDNHMADVIGRMKQAMAASIEGLFQIFGPDCPLGARRSALSLEKYYRAVCSWKKIQLGNMVDTRRMIVSYPEDKIKKITLLLTDWHKHRRSFTLKQGAQLLGNLEHLSTWCTWLRYLSYALRDSIMIALRANRTKVYNNRSMAHFVSDSKLPGHDWQKLLKKHFAHSQIAKAIWELKTSFFINQSMRQELILLLHIFNNTQKYKIHMPIAHYIPRSPDFLALGDACLQGAGGFCDRLKFWFFLPWPKAITDRTIDKFANQIKNKQAIDKNLITSINLLEFITIIILYLATSQAIQESKIDIGHSYPTVRILSDNTSAVAWTKKACTSSESGKALTRLLCFVMINNNLGLDSHHISGNDNEQADHISRLHSSSQQELFKKYPQLRTYRRYHPNPGLLSMFWRALLSGSSPKWRTLKQQGHFSPATNIGSTSQKIISFH